LPKMKSNFEYHVDISFVLINDEPWAKKGFEIASNQLPIKVPGYKFEKRDKNATLMINEGMNAITIKGRDYTVIIESLLDGGLRLFDKKGRQLISRHLYPNFKRPLTDNDRRGWKPQRKLKQWYDAAIKLSSVDKDKANNEMVTLTSTYSLINDSARLKVVYSVKGDGIIKVDYTLNIKTGLPNIPKIGMQCGINKNFTQIEYFGKGPLENYIDRRYGMDAGVFSQDIYEFMESYVVPQENGNRTDVRWMYLSDPKTKDGLLIVADSLLSMSAWPYTQKNIEEAKHTNKLKPADYITLNIDLVQMGVGGNDSWSDVAAPLEQYQIKAKDYQYSFYIVPFNSKNKSAGERAKELKF
jgi:beta-galactosidase